VDVHRKSARSLTKPPGHDFQDEPLDRRLGCHAVELVAPHGLDTAAYLKILGERRAVRFDSRFFGRRVGSPASYSALMVSELFYDQFAAYEHILIHQTDVFVFEDQLASWSQAAFDYVGPPHWKGWRATPEEGIQGVGNGGFSLRRTEAFRRALHDSAGRRRLAFVRPAGRALAHAQAGRLTEDLFWGYHAPIVVASIPEAIAFGFEMGLPLIDEYRRGVMPFGCHADWNMRLIANYWRGTPESRAPDYEGILYELLERSGNGMAYALRDSHG
jgi:hypothetical protein